MSPAWMWRPAAAGQAVWGNQIIRYTNREVEKPPSPPAMPRASSSKSRRSAAIDLHCRRISAKRPAPPPAWWVLRKTSPGCILGKVALITGGSAGIGGQVARLLALAGAKVMMVARRKSELEAARERIIGELRDIGFSGVERRVRIMADVDVSDFASLKTALDETIKAWGRVDYLINNAGVAGR
jgi:malonyl-CoA reductase/3-hydroxypropionate dehydrogenase (NADP+)